MVNALDMVQHPNTLAEAIYKPHIRCMLRSATHYCTQLTKLQQQKQAHWKEICMSYSLASRR